MQLFDSRGSRQLPFADGDLLFLNSFSNRKIPLREFFLFLCRLPQQIQGSAKASGRRRKAAVVSPSGKRPRSSLAENLSVEVPAVEAHEM